MDDLEQLVGHEVGVVRIRVGLASSFHEVWKVIRFVATIADKKSRQVLWDRWMDTAVKAI